MYFLFVIFISIFVEITNQIKTRICKKNNFNFDYVN